MEIITRKQAIELGLTHYFTGKSCKRGHDPAPRRVKDKQCPTCNREDHDEWLKNNRDKKRDLDREYLKRVAETPELAKRQMAQKLAYRQKHIEKFREIARARAAKRRKEHPEKVAEAHKNWLLRNPGKMRAAVDNWQARNKHVLAEIQSTRRAKKRSATPRWLSAQQMASIRTKFLEAKWMTDKSGFDHVVDHIVPLKSDTVCGLHVPWNLRVITDRSNAKKGNRYWPDMP